jgi:hypothetical protein
MMRRGALLASGWLDRQMLPDRCGRRLSCGGDVEMVLRTRNAGYDLWYNPAMRLEHMICARRMNVGYLWRHQRAAGRTLPTLIAMGHRRTPTLRWRMRHLRRALGALARSICDALIGSSRGGRKLRVELALGIGWVEGAAAALLAAPRSGVER